MKQLEIVSGDGVSLPLSWFPAKQSRWTLLFLPALGIQSRMYNVMAKSLSEAGCSVCLMEQRGHGRSPLRASRSVNWGYDHYLQYDIPATFEWLTAQPETAGLPLVMGGHSLGSHLSSIYSGQHPEHLQGVLHVACGSPYYADFEPTQSRLIRMLCYLMPLFKWVPGYFPGSRLGFAGRESIELMYDWRDWALTGSLNYGEHQDLQSALANFTGAMLAVSMADDDFSSKKAEQRAIAGFSAARISQVRLERDESGQSLGHFNWARSPEATVQAVLEWLQREFP
jgi:predicted alpha/beta hydrolase